MFWPQNYILVKNLELPGCQDERAFLVAILDLQNI